MRLMDEGLDVNEVDALGHTPLHVAAGSEEPNSGCLCECDFLGLVSQQPVHGCAPPAMQTRTHTLTMSIQLLHVLCMCVCVCVHVCVHHGGVLITHRRCGSAAL